MFPRPLPQREKVLPGVHVPPGRKERERRRKNPAARGRVPEHLRGAPCESPKQACLRHGEADQVITAVRRGAEHDRCVGGQFPERLADPCGGEGRAVGSDDHHALRPVPERRRRRVPHPVPEIPAALRVPFERGERRAPQGALRPRRVEEQVSPYAGQAGDFVRRVPEHAGVQMRRFAGIERRAKAGLDPAGARDLRHQHDRLLHCASVPEIRPACAHSPEIANVPKTR